MCFSPEVDLVAGIAITAIGIDTLRQVEHPRERAIAALPLVFGLHQFSEAFVWWALEGRITAHSCLVDRRGAYVVATCGSLLLSSDRYLVLFGAVNLARGRASSQCS